jgi:hypothetical protein
MPEKSRTLQSTGGLALRRIGRAVTCFTGRATAIALACRYRLLTIAAPWERTGKPDCQGKPFRIGLIKKFERAVA